MTKVRGLQIHTLHPLEYMRTLLEPSEQHLWQRRSHVVDWLVKTGQNHLQWPVLGSVDWRTFAVHATQYRNYTHSTRSDGRRRRQSREQGHAAAQLRARA